MQKKSFDEYVSNIVRVVFCVVFFAAITYLVIFATCSKVKGLIPGNVTYLEKWVVSYNGGMRQKLDMPIKVNAGKGNAVAFETDLPQFIPEGSWLAFKNSKDIIVKVNGSERFAWNSESVNVPGGIVKSAFMYVPIYAKDAGGRLTIIKHGSDDNGNIPYVLMGDSLAVTYELLRIAGMTPFVISLTMFFVSTILAISCLFLQRLFGQKLNLLSMSVAVMGVSAWLVTDSDVFQLIFNTKYIDGFISYIFTLIVILPFVVYIDDMQEHRYKKVYSVLCIIDICNMVICTCLHVFGIVNFYKMLMPLDMVIAWIAVIVCGCTIIDVVSKRAREYKYVACGLLVFLVLAIAEIASLNAESERIDGILILVGMVVMVVAAISQQFYDIKVHENEKAAAIEADKAKNDFLAKMSHEFRTPINSIVGMNEMILDENQDPTIREYAKRIERSGKVLLNMVEDILDYSKLQSDQFESIYEDYNARKMLKKIVEDLSEEAAVNDLGVNFGIEGELPEYLNGDEWYITRVLQCFISNAVKYTEKGSITFTVECRNIEDRYELVLSVSDTGIGIDDETKERLFKPFVRGDVRNVHDITGAGLGLAIAKRLVDSMGGEISVESKVGEGSTFTVTLPQFRAVENHDEEASGEYEPVIENKICLTKAVEYTPEPDDSAISTFYTAPNANILAVDDNSANLVVVRELLKKTKVCFESASSGTEAIEKCKVKKYDIILMDHMMPQPDGVETMHIIRDSLESINRRTKILVLTANAVGDDCRQKYIQEGFDDFMSKPVDREILLKMIRKYLNPKLVVEEEPQENVSGNVSDASTAGTVKNQVTDGTKDTEANNIGAQVGEKEENGIMDIDGMLRRFEGNQSVANMILAECIKEGRKKIPLLRELFEAGDISRYAVEAHGVKGVMASVCANDFSAHAKQHEFAGKENRTDFIRDDLDAFLEEYKTVLEFIENYLKDQGVEVEKPRVIDKSEDSDDNFEELLYEVEEALDDFDIDKALSLIDRLESVADEKYIGTIEEVRQYADDFEYDKAKEALLGLKS